MRRFADKFPPASVVDGTARASERAEVRLLSTSFRNTGKVLDVAAAIQRDLRQVAPEVPRLIAPPQRANRGAVVCALLPTSTDEARWVAEQVAGLLRLPGGLARDQAGGAGEDAAWRAVEADEDHLTRAVADFTKDAGSLVEALDDLGNPAAYSAEGYPRLSALAAELRALRRHVGRPLPELVTEVERALGLDVEVAARPGSSPAAARADLDAFADASAAFAGDAQEPTVGAFLAYLTAAETEEFGLEAGQVSDTDAVKLATVHSAKGLQWPAVVVPGLAAGTRAQNFPARQRMTTRWTDNPRLLPFWLRGDEADLPALAGLDPDSLAAFGHACADRNLAEERRLAYVAVTRAAYWLPCTGYWLGAGHAPVRPSPVLA